MTLNSNSTPNDRYAIIKTTHDSTGREVSYPDTVYVGSYNAVMERVFDSKQRREALTLKNEANHIREEKRALTAAREDVAARADAVIQSEDLIRQLCDAVNTLRTRVDAFEETQRSKADAEERARNEEPITLPPGTSGDGELGEPEHPLLDPIVADTDDETHGELTTHPPTGPVHPEQLEASEDDDEGPGDLPPELTAKVQPITGTDPALPGRPREPTVRNPVGTNW